ncbi:unnamed protein product [Oikopleura dioica]|uniref:Uncharacterized protein n=1 Tax=Oikopleura dioica TaxID=34765 RepID=E4XMA5_OIKDI|nr:unnamed protein product [Oikopleura dioica]
MDETNSFMGNKEDWEEEYEDLVESMRTEQHSSIKEREEELEKKEKKMKEWEDAQREAYGETCESSSVSTSASTSIPTTPSSSQPDEILPSPSGYESGGDSEHSQRISPKRRPNIRPGHDGIGYSDIRLMSDDSDSDALSKVPHRHSCDNPVEHRRPAHESSTVSPRFQRKVNKISSSSGRSSSSLHLDVDDTRLRKSSSGNSLNSSQPPQLTSLGRIRPESADKARRNISAPQLQLIEDCANLTKNQPHHQPMLDLNDLRLDPENGKAFLLLQILHSIGGRKRLVIDGCKIGISKWPHISVECLLYRLQHYSQVASLILDKFWQPSEVKKMAKFLPIMEESYNIAKKMNRFGYLKEDDEKEEEKNQQGFYNQHFA